MRNAVFALAVSPDLVAPENVRIRLRAGSGRRTIAGVVQAAAGFPGVQVGGNGPFNVEFASAAMGTSR